MKDLEIIYGSARGGGKSYHSLMNFADELSLIHIKSVAKKDYLRKLKRKGRLTRIPRGCQ